MPTAAARNGRPSALISILPCMVFPLKKPRDRWVWVLTCLWNPWLTFLPALASACCGGNPHGACGLGWLRERFYPAGRRMCGEMRVLKDLSIDWDSGNPSRPSLQVLGLVQGLRRVFACGCSMEGMPGLSRLVCSGSGGWLPCPIGLVNQTESGFRLAPSVGGCRDQLGLV